MDQLWTMFSKWTPIGQGLFLLLMVTLFVALIDKLSYYIIVLFRGWPPQHCVEAEEEE